MDKLFYPIIFILRFYDMIFFKINMKNRNFWSISTYCVDTIYIFPRKAKNCKVILLVKGIKSRLDLKEAISLLYHLFWFLFSDPSPFSFASFTWYQESLSWKNTFFSFPSAQQILLLFVYHKLILFHINSITTKKI